MQIRSVPTRPASHGSRQDRAVFSSLEWLVIAIGSRHDTVPLSSSAIGRSLLQLYGAGSEELSGPNLEILRRTSALARRCGWNLPAAETGVFLRAGWTEHHLEELIESVSRVSSPPEWKSTQLGDVGALAA
jgi:hypothetical protein